MTLPSVQARRKVAPVAPGQSRSGRGNLEQPVVDIWVSECLVLPFPESRLQDDHRSKLFGSCLTGPDIPIAADSLGMSLNRQLSRKSLSDLFLFPRMDENAENTCGNRT